MAISQLFSNPMAFLQSLLISAPAVLISLTLHEISHGMVANWCGDPTAKRLGRLSLNPLHHLDPMGTVLLFLFGFGYAKPVPINPNYFRHPHRDDFFVSIAGITMNLILFVVFGFLFYAVQIWGWTNSYLISFISMMISMNASLAVFNLLPIPPLDGYHIVNDLIFKGNLFASRNAMYIGQGVLLVLLVSGLMSRYLGFCINWLVTGLNWLVMNVFQFIGVF